MIETKGYIGTYKVFYEEVYNENGNPLPSPNEDDSYLLGRSNSQIYRYDQNNLSIYFPKGKSTENVVLPLLDNLNVTYELFVSGYSESIYIVPEKYINELNTVLSFKTKGAKEQLKDHKRKLKELKKQSKNVK